MGYNNFMYAFVVNVTTRWNFSFIYEIIIIKVRRNVGSSGNSEKYHMTSIIYAWKEKVQNMDRHEYGSVYN